MKKFFKTLLIVIMLVYLFAPLVATFFYAISMDWSVTLLPRGFSLEWFKRLLSEPRFLQAILRTSAISFMAVALAAVLIVPSIFAIHVYYPRLEKVAEGLVIACYSFPGVILAFSLMNTYSSWGLPMIVIVVFSYVVSTYPFIRQGTLTSLRAIHAETLMQSAEILGASQWTAFRKIILPNIMPGVFSSCLFSFSTLFGEFVIVNLILGAKFETVQILLRTTLSKNGHLSSAIVILYFMVICLLTAFAIGLTKKQKGLNER
ncbi:MAG: ABC transporter permease subunit [Peptoniphilus sp.]|nr:ABC transporter permease subunit [Peptoniphilus sp.]MDD7363569.1 ABC transporter permease subunit [Bacillota bacterium]MDY6044683.1 ABC transporter permease subunit [Peptoniphilus sp.]